MTTNDRIAPLCKAFFERYPLSRADTERIAAETGYRPNTVRNWLRGNIKSNTKMFDYIVNDYLTPRYPTLDCDMMAAARSECVERSHTPGVPRNRDIPSQRDKVQQIPLASAGITSALHSYAVIHALVGEAMKLHTLSEVQRFALVRLLASEEGTW